LTATIGPSLVCAPSPARRLALALRSGLWPLWVAAMVKSQSKNWGLRAALCAAVVVWQICEMATASVFAPDDFGYVRYLIVGVALVGLVASLLKLVVET
jgi:phosphoglycerol transferase MdoB-like AlkP superfamily enzyme